MRTNILNINVNVFKFNTLETDKKNVNMKTHFIKYILFLTGGITNIN